MTNEMTDAGWGAFSGSGQWEVPEAGCQWQRDLDRTREQVAASVPELTSRVFIPPMGRLSVTVAHLGYGLGRWAISRRDLPARLRVAAEHLGPSYIKLGQIISSGRGLFPDDLVEEFSALRDRVPAEPFSAIVEVVEADLGRPLHHVFATFDTKPLAAASIAQVHAATLTTGESVVVKVQRPTVAARVRADLRVMAWIAPFLVGRIPVTALANPPALVELFAETITEELDFRLEAENMIDLARSFAALGQRGYVIPRPHPTLVTERVLVMERLDGFAFDDVAGMHAAGIDTTEVVRTGMIGFLEGAMFNGLFHGDLHVGNLVVLADGRTGLLDFGITARLSESERQAFLRLLIGASMNDIATQLGALRDLGALPPDADLSLIITELGLDQVPVDPTTLSPEQLTAEIQRVVKALLGSGARLPKPLMLFVKNLVFLDGAIATLAPDLDLLAEITNIAMYFSLQHGERIASEAGLGNAEWDLDLSALQASVGVDPAEGGSLTHRELQERREVVRSRMVRPRRGRRR